MPCVTGIMNGDIEDRADRLVRLSKAAYLMVKGSIGEDLVKREELIEALQYAGFNPTKRSIGRHWIDSTRRLTFSQFCNITEIEPIPTETSLVSFFEKLDDKNMGYLTHDDFILNMTTRGEKLPAGVIERLITDEKYNKDKKFFYKKFCDSVIETSERLGSLALEKLQKEEEDFMVNSKTYKIKRKTASPEKTLNGVKTPSRPASASRKSSTSDSPRNLNNQSRRSSVDTRQPWNCHIRSKGSFFFENENIISHQYALTATKTAKYKVVVQAEKQYRNNSSLVDVQLYIFDENKRFICRTEKNSGHGMWEWEGQLVAGRYTIIPFTSATRFKRRNMDQEMTETPLIERFPKIKLTREFQQLLSDVFVKVDLDSNGTLSRTEFNLFNWRTSGEEVADEEWTVVEENFPLKNGELTLDGFLTLHQMEAEDNDGDPSELRVTVQAMGYNKSLIQDESASFVVMVASQDPDTSMSLCGLKSGGVLLEKTVTRCAIEADKQPTRVRGLTNVLVYKEVTDSRITFVLQNKSEGSVNIQMDLSRSTGIVTNKQSPIFTVCLAKKSSMIATHVLPEEDGAPWNLEAEAKIIK